MIDELLQKKLKNYNPDRRELKKAVDSLYRRGFSWEEISAAILRYEPSIDE
jgi:SOS response regulatory protein OraA/RecX